MTTAVNKYGICGRTCTAVPAAQKEEKEIDEDRRDDISFISMQMHTES